MVSETLKQRIFAISDVTRLTIMIMLSKGPMYVKKMLDRLDIESTLLSHHLAILKKAKLVKSTREGKTVKYEKVPGGVKQKDLDRIFN